MMGDVRTAPIPGQSLQSDTGREGAAQAKPSDYQADLARYRKWLRAFETNKQDEQKEAQQARKYYHDKQWTEAELKKLKKRRQPPTQDNTVKRKIDFLVGVEQRMRRDPKGFPRTPRHENDADVSTKGIRYVCDANQWAGTTATDSMHNGLVSGVGVCWVGIKTKPQAHAQPGQPPRKDVIIKGCEPERFVYDSRSKQPDFSDARWMGVDVWQDIDEAKEGVSPEIAAKLDSLVDSAKGGTSGLPADEDQAQQWGDYEQRRIRMVELYEKRVTPPYMQPVWHYCKFTADVVIEAMISPYLDEDGMPDNPYIAWSPYVDEKGDRYGVNRTMKPLQDSINHKRSRLDHEISRRQTFSNRGGSVDDVDKFKEEINLPDGHLEFAGGEWGKDVGIIDRSAIFAGHAELLQMDQQRLENYGPNPGLLGKGPGMADSSGRALLAQRDTGMTELSPVFERHRNWKLRCYRAIWFRMRQAWTEERWINITDDPNSPQFMGINQYSQGPDGSIQGNNVVARIDDNIILDEGPDTVVMQEELLQTLTQLVGAPPTLWKVFVDLSNVPDKERLNKLIDDAQAPPPAIAEMQARMAHLEELLNASKVDVNAATVEEKRANIMTKLLAAATPAAAPMDKLTGRPTGPAPQPDLNLLMQLMQAMQAFPLHYGQPTVEQQAEAAPPPGAQAPGPPNGQPGQPPPGTNGHMPPPGMMPPPGSNATLPPPNQMMPGAQ